MWTICSLVILPLLSLIGGILGLNSDPKERARNKWILAVLLFSALASIALAISDHQADATQKKSDDENISYLKQSLTQVLGNTQEIKGSTEDIKALLARVLSGFGVAQGRVESIQKNGLSSSADVKLVQAGIAGDDLIKTLLAPVQTENQKQQTTVVYYAKDVDPGSVNGPPLISSLLQAGFKPVQTTQGRKNPDLSTNAIWVGQDVPIEQAKIVAYTLMRAGVEIRAIRPFSGTGRNPHEIEIGADAAIVRRPPLTYDQIQAMQALSRNLD
jgi:hypothetical protein